MTQIRFLKFSEADAHRVMQAAFDCLVEEAGTAELDTMIAATLGVRARVVAGIAKHPGGIDGAWLSLPRWTSHLPDVVELERAVTGWADARGYTSSSITIQRAGCGHWSAALFVARLRPATMERPIGGRCVGAHTEALARTGACLNLVAKLLGWKPEGTQTAVAMRQAS